MQKVCDSNSKLLNHNKRHLLLRAPHGSALDRRTFLNHLLKTQHLKEHEREKNVLPFVRDANLGISVGLRVRTLRLAPSVHLCEGSPAGIATTHS